MKVEFDDHGLRERLRAFPGEADRAAEQGIADIAETVRAKAVEYAPVSEGTLRKSISVVQQGRVATVGPNTSYAASVEFGSKPHFLPRRAIDGQAPRTPTKDLTGPWPQGTLAFWAEKHGMPGAHWAIARKIALYGTPAQPYMSTAVAEVQPAAGSMILRRLREAWKRLSGGKR